jgi:hypothetical protein
MVRSASPKDRPVTVTDTPPQEGMLKRLADTTGPSKEKDRIKVPADPDTVISTLACDWKLLFARTRTEVELDHVDVYGSRAAISDVTE